MYIIITVWLIGNSKMPVGVNGCRPSPCLAIYPGCTPRFARFQQGAAPLNDKGGVILLTVKSLK